MKASKILAGLSAAAIAASMVSMVSVSAEQEVGYSGERHIQITDEASKWWTEEKIANNELFGDIAIDDVVGIELVGNTDTNFIFQYKPKDSDEYIQHSGKTSYTLTADDIANMDIDALDFSIALGTGNVGDETTVTWNILIDNGEETDSTESTNSTESTDSTESASEPVAVEFPYTVDAEEGYVGKWGQDGLVPMSVIEAVPEGESLEVTITYNLEDGYDYYIAAPFSNTTGWGKVYDEADRPTTIAGLDLKSSFTNDELEEHGSTVGTPLLQNDGSIVIFPAGGTTQEATFTLTADGIAYLKAQYEKFGGDGGLGFQVYGVDITEITVNVPSAEDNEVVYEIGEGVSFNNSFSWAPTDADGEYTSAKINLTGTSTDLGDEALNVYWNDWCAYYVCVTDDQGGKTYYAVGGPSVNWDVTCVDAENEEDKVIIPNADVKKTEKDTGNITLEVPFGNGYSIEVVGLSWGEEEKTEEQKNAPYILVKDIALTTNSVPTPDSSSVPDSSSTSSVDPTTSETSSANATTSTTSSNTSSTTSTTSTKTTTTTTTKTDTNPSTGAAALGAVGVLLAGAAMVVSKKKD